MSDEGRRIFPMETALAVVAAKGGADVLDFLGYAVRREVCECSRAGVNPAVKGWLYSLNPEFAKAEFDGSVSFETWMNEQKMKLGQSLSIPPMPEHETADIGAMMDGIAAVYKNAEEKAEEAEAAEAARAALEAEIKALSPFKKKAEDLEKKAAQLEEKNGALTKEIAELKAQLAAFDGKVAVDEADIGKSVKDIVSKAVKDALGGLAAAGGAVATAGTADAEPGEPASFDSGFGDAPAEPANKVPDDFGFGTSGADGDGFGF